MISTAGGLHVYSFAQHRTPGSLVPRERTTAGPSLLCEPKASCLADAPETPTLQKSPVALLWFGSRSSPTATKTQAKQIRMILNAAETPGERRANSCLPPRRVFTPTLAVAPTLVQKNKRTKTKKTKKQNIAIKAEEHLATCQSSSAAHTA